MNRSMIRAIVGGLLLGAGVFFIPFFILRVALFVLVVGLLFRLFAGRGGYRRHLEYRFAMADRIRNMSDDEYAQFKDRATYKHGCGRRPFNNQNPTEETTQQ